MAVRTSSAAENLLGLTIRCEKCGGYAFLVKCVLDAYVNGLRFGPTNAPIADANPSDP